MRVNIEEPAWKRIYRLADLMDCSVREAAGTVACLWAQSQDLIKTHGNRDELIEWSSLLRISESDVEKWISGLEKARFISCEENGHFRIHGNETQLESIAAKSNRASKGGKALQKKMRELKKLKAGLKPAASKLGEAPRGSMQFNALQGNAIQCNSKQGNAINVSNSSNLTSQIWDTYRDAYFLRYLQEPVRNKKVNSQIKQLAERLGAEAPDVVRFYVHHPKTFYVSKLHEIGLCLSDAESLRTQWAKGKAISNQDLKRYEQNQSYADIVDASKEGKI